MFRRSSCVDSDYDYPAAQAKPILALPRQAPQIPMPAKRPSLIRRASSGRRGENVGAQTMSAYTDGSVIHDHNALKKNFLSITLPSLAGKSKTIKANGVYYDVPKNIPVNPIFALGQMESLKEEGYLYQNVNIQPPPPPLNKPQVPPKSSQVLNKMSTVTACKSQDKARGQLALSATLSRPLATTCEPLNDNFSILNRKTTSKTLPSIPSETGTPPPLAEDNKKMADGDLRDLMQGYKRISLEKDQEEEEDPCDYEYDYVCLESTKRLNQEQASIKAKLAEHLQPRYERIVLASSSADFTLVNLERMATTSNLSNANIRSQILLRYRQIYSNAFESFQQWTNLSIEIINRDYEPPVIFNFLKHILLSAQMLITIINSLKRHVKFEDGSNLRHQAINRFSSDFMERLRVIVVKAKRANNRNDDGNRNLAFQIRQEVIYSIQETFDLADTLKVSLNNVC